MSRINSRLSLYIFAFILVCVLDPVAFSLQLAGIQKIPFGILGVIITLMLLIERSLSMMRDRFDMSTVFLVVLYISIFFVAVSSRYFELSDVWAWAQNVSYFALGSFACRYFSSRGLSRSLSIIFVVAIASSASLWFYLSSRIFVSGEIEKLNYLYVSDSICVLAIIAVSYAPSVLVRWTVIVFAATSIYFVGSRFALLGFIFAALAMTFRGASWRTRLVLVFVFVGGVLGLIGYLDSLNLDVNDNRFVRLFMFTENDTSLNARIEDDMYARDMFLSDPLIGAGYKSYMKYGEGNYAHNVLSIVYDFGVLGVLFLVAVVVALGNSIWKILGRPHESVAIGLVVFLMLATFSKFYMWWGYYFIIGYLITAAKIGKIRANK